jgi:hypothetical protein
MNPERSKKDKDTDKLEKRERIEESKYNIQIFPNSRMLLLWKCCLRVVLYFQTTKKALLKSTFLFLHKVFKYSE